MIEQVYVLAFPLRSLVSMNLIHDSLQAISSVFSFRDFSLVRSSFFQRKVPDTSMLLQIIRLVRPSWGSPHCVNLWKSEDRNGCIAPGSHKQGFEMKLGDVGSERHERKYHSSSKLSSVLPFWHRWSFEACQRWVTREHPVSLWLVIKQYSSSAHPSYILLIKDWSSLWNHSHHGVVNGRKVGWGQFSQRRDFVRGTETWEGISKWSYLRSLCVGKFSVD